MDAEDEPILLSPPDVGPAEREALVAAFDGGWIAPLGPAVDAFEADLAAYVGVEACAALVSGSAALHLSLLLAGVGPGDEVVVQTATFAASAFAVAHIGAVPVFCDVDRRTWNLDPGLLEELLADRAARGRVPRAVVAVDLYGCCPDYEAIEATCARYGVALVEDAAESLGSRSAGRAAGGFGASGVLSFNGNKLITTSGGGALLGGGELVARARHLAAQARRPVGHYEHDEVGFNYRLSNLLAAVGRAQLAGIEAKVMARRAVFERYRRALPEIDWMPAGVTERANRWLSVGLLPAPVDPSAVCEALARRRIECRRTWKPMHAQPVFAGVGCHGGGGIADELFDRGLCLPSGSSLSEAQQGRVIDELRALVRS